MKLNADKSSENSEIHRLKSKFKNLKSTSNFLDAERLRLSEKIGLLQQQQQDYEKQRDEYDIWRSKSTIRESRAPIKEPTMITLRRVLNRSEISP